MLLTDELLHVRVSVKGTSQLVPVPIQLSTKIPVSYLVYAQCEYKISMCLAIKAFFPAVTRAIGPLVPVIKVNVPALYSALCHTRSKE